MNWLQRIGLAWKAATSLELFREVYGTRAARTGHSINVDTATAVPTVMACARVWGDAVAAVPFRLMQRVGKRTIPAADHPLAELFARRPNPLQSSFEFRETLGLHLALGGNAISALTRVGSKREIREIRAYPPGSWTVEEEEPYRLAYKLRTKTGESERIRTEDVWHVRGPSWDGVAGMETLKLIRNAVGLALALEEQSADLMKNGAQVGGVLAVKGSLNAENYRRLQSAIDKQADERRHRPLVVDQEGKWMSNTMTGVDAQHLEQRRHQIEDICRAFRVLPIMIGHPADMAARAAIESMAQMHQMYLLGPLYARIESSANATLLTPEEVEQGFYFKFFPNALMRASAKDRAEFYAKALGAGGGKGWLSQNEVREFEDADPADDPEADELPQPLGAAPVAADEPATPAEEEPVKEGGEEEEDEDR